jgi:aspartate carbamoyltransferase regulatory subunit
MKPNTPVYAIFECLNPRCKAIRPLFERTETGIPAHARRSYKCVHCGKKGATSDIENPMRLSEFETTFNFKGAK